MVKKSTWDYRIREAYQSLNDVFFDSAIRLDKSKVSYGKLAKRTLGVTNCGKNGPFEIIISNILIGNFTHSRIVLLHEMAHANTFQDGYVAHNFNSEGHGQRFHAEMDRLWKMGAFEGLL